MKAQEIRKGTIVELNLREEPELNYAVVTRIYEGTQTLFFANKLDDFGMLGLANDKTSGNQVLVVFNYSDIKFFSNVNTGQSLETEIYNAKRNYRDEHTGETLREMFNRVRHEFSSYADDIGFGGTCGMDFNAWLDWLVASNKLEASIAEANKEWED